jgi:cytochrome c5
LRLTLILLVPVLLLAACSRPHGPPPGYASLRPSNAHLAQLYESSCKACHANPASGAPLVHDHDQWDPRVEKGMEVLTLHAITGFGAMPAGGQCAACKLDDYRGLIRFMADRGGEQ